MNKLLVVFNTCGLKGYNHNNHYIEHLNSVLQQDFDDFKVVVSECKTNPQHRNELEKTLDTADRKLFYHYIDDLHTVNVTFNKAVKSMVSLLGEFDGYLYLDSGVYFKNPKSISILYDLSLIHI